MSKIRTVRVVDVTEMGNGEVNWTREFMIACNVDCNDAYHDWCWEDYEWAVEEGDKEGRLLGDKLISMGAVVGEDLLIKVWW